MGNTCDYKSQNSTSTSMANLADMGRWLQCRQDWPPWTPANAFLQLAVEEDEHGSIPPATQTSKDVTGIHAVIDITNFSTIDKF